MRFPRSEHISIFFAVISISLAFVSSSTAMASSSKAREVLEAAGYTNIRDEVMSLIGCSKDDSRIASRKFQARAPGGQDGTVRVCCGLAPWSGCTIRAGGW